MVMKKDDNLPVKHGEILPPARTIGIRVGGDIYLPALPIDPTHARAIGGCADEHTKALISIDRYFAINAALNAPRVIACNPAAEMAAEAEQRRDQEHQRELAELRRQREVVDERTKLLLAEQR